MNMQDTAEQCLERNFLALNANIGKEENSQINYFSFYLSKLERKNKMKGSRRKYGNRNQWIDKPLTGLRKKRRYISPVSGMEGNNTTNPADMKRILREHHHQLYPHKFSHLDENQFPENRNLSKITKAE